MISEEQPTQQELLGLSLIEKRKAHAMNNGITIEESRKRITPGELLDSAEFAMYGYTAFVGRVASADGNGTYADRG
jgi:hypothetical protein